MEVQALREALRRSERSSSALSEKLNELSLEHDRKLLDIQDSCRRDANDLKLKLNREIAERHSLIEKYEECRLRLEFGSSALAEAHTRLARADEHIQRQNRAHDDFVKEWTNINRKLASEISRLQNELTDLNS